MNFATLDIGSIGILILALLFIVFIVISLIKKKVLLAFILAVLGIAVVYFEIISKLK